MKKMLCLWMVLFLSVCFPAQAEEIPESARALIPEGADIASDQSVGSVRILTLQLASGEILDLVYDLSHDAPLYLVTRTAASSDAQSAQERAAAEALARGAYPDAWILAAGDAPDGAKRLSLMTDTLCGEVDILGDVIVSRDLRFGMFAQNSTLTIDGALAAMRLLRPDAEYIALEFDADDGALLYEGNALVDGIEYEFELDARSAQLLEWERD